jgi:transposase
VLVTNLPSRSTLANKVVAIYRQRMQIEEGFRDVKSPLFGLGFGMHQSRQGRRIEILLLIAMLANVAIMVAGLGVRTNGQQKRYQSVTIHSKTSCHPNKFLPTVTSHFPTRGYSHEKASHPGTVADPD